MVKRNSHLGRSTQESSLSRFKNWPENEIFSKMCIPTETPFFIRLDGWRLRKLSETLKARNPSTKNSQNAMVHLEKSYSKKVSTQL